MATRAFADGEYDPCASRAYYAVFQAAIAALLKLTDARPRMVQGRFVWEHDWVPGQFNRRLIHERKLFSSDLVNVPSELLQRRHEADYYENRVSEKTARRSLDKAKRFVEAVQEKLGD